MKNFSPSTRCILWIGAFSNNVNDYVHESIHCYHLPIHEAAQFLQEEKEKIDAIIVTTILKHEEILRINEVAFQKSIPVMLYTLAFDQSAKELTLDLGVDEYCYGTLSPLTLKRFEFIKKLKLYKKQRTNAEDNSFKHLKANHGAVVKRAFDILVSAFILLMLSPVIIIISFIIMLKLKGQFLESSKRVGLGFKTFSLYKFRTSSPQNSMSSSHSAQFFTRSGLNELPAFYNVFKGDMSIVGNRPLSPTEAEKLTEDQIAVRFMAPAGITGLWRIRLQDNPDCDIEYAISNSFWKDLKILFLTFLLPFSQKRIKFEPA